ncbi:MAG: fumarate hydratase [Armatimonadetes bacterium CG_4_10_14_3_um_filter_66_18]|nr:Fe-S-containing hydro-lyase [Armatimonadota bacterium]OIP10758.1 MAG: fumarate hydratase [Armatimonadetes bacterium CG2_30_66_41]PIU94828.1 MAG: fumarate hydratase [Armatimonadetes bacterium CG06_land_8_20_14_3_00_66_21]PIW14824.1 MAG: fumarate hydratase [Armatimonadetes bacterium CG17_big_fil_post_rev_8_21_14_2_50_66_6]PIX36774.1 MAG: fumarate hydratase [Armatimonadetes bacterium CG_4_8_14_3_um_filter_66_20]PIY39136.1 MAG: fumarate hydratase [Armatimonadetes bacterium CG_4_10_14_3_um_filte
MAEPIRIEAPLTEEVVCSLRAGDRVLINGVMLTGRDSAHQRLFDLLEAGEPLPFDPEGQIIYYTGPTPPKPGQVIGSAGPTTSYRMDKFAPALLAKGLRGMVGKGKRGAEVIAAMKEHKGVYFGATGGAAALIAKCIKEAEVICYADLGPEAIRRLRVEDFPAVVINDAFGNDLYKDGVKQYRKE